MEMEHRMSFIDDLADWAFWIYIGGVALFIIEFGTMAEWIMARDTSRGGRIARRLVACFLGLPASALILYYAWMNETLPFPFRILGTMVVGFVLILFGFKLFSGRQDRQERGLCVQCSYDLTGNESGICPECGTKIAREK